ncbi:MAG: hypothetical protein WCF84_24145 [Anaerolineae bacterium]
MPREDDTLMGASGQVSAGGSAPASGDAAALQSRISSLQSRLNDIPSKIRLSDVRDEVGNLETKSNHVADLANAVRQQGYAWEKDLEPRCLDYRQRWQTMKPNIIAAIDRESSNLGGRETQIEYQVNWGIRNASESNLGDAERLLDGFERDTTAAHDSIRGMYSPFSTELTNLESHLNEIKSMLDQAAQSRVSWLPGEALVLAVRAQWDREGNDDPRGFLMLSDQRLLFERNEDVATKKVLFVATAKQHVQEVMFDQPLAQLQSVIASKRGLMGHEDHLDFTFSGAKYRSAHFHIEGQDCNTWQGMVNRARSGGLEEMRVKPVSDDETNRLKNAPTHCANCGGALNAPVLRGQTEVKCPYCGTSNRF